MEPLFGNARSHGPKPSRNPFKEMTLAGLLLSYLLGVTVVMLAIFTWWSILLALAAVITTLIFTIATVIEAQERNITLKAKEFFYGKKED